ncbi:TetR/AcrR family transcriptional regulator [Streptomyces sp. DSM 44938]|uniref:TetR/AcrR family transcriptional regulator n=1 Tax=Streptomyces litchfieldiae TaxID=3075543 RepID=A0ABU2N3I5_9ACTN|nr:TetR/AcrR family transcriptional regulator [Streptomyces sp. DSM 44938]MDT0347618.1 TetR/AcrR family transcriptional regulator [Streptomyces sp. DSM 44938]
MSGASGATRGRIDKRQAILDAAFRVFAREGFAKACVQAIATEAGVAKPTVYNHLTDKATLFRHAMAAATEAATAESLAAVERLLDRDPADGGVRAVLEDVGHRMLVCYCAEDSRAVRRLLYAEVGRFPDLLDIVLGRGPSRVGEILADRLARLMLAGRLRTADPAAAGEQFVALLTGPMEARSRFGTRQVPDDELRAVAAAAAETFLRAYGLAATD